MTTVKVLNEFEVKEIAYQTCYLMMHGWKRYIVTYDVLEKERPDLEYEDKDHLWMKEITECIGGTKISKGFETQLTEYYKKPSPYFTLDEAYYYEMSKLLTE